MVQLLYYISWIILSWLYFALQESSRFQVTLGKRGAGAIVVNAENERITLGQATLRWLIKQIPILNLISFIVLAIDEKKQGLHDKAAGTFVVYRPNKSSIFSKNRYGKQGRSYLLIIPAGISSLQIYIRDSDVRA